MTLKDMKNIQVAADMLQVIGNAQECKPYETPDYIQDAYYGANTLWLTLQEMIKKEVAK